MTDHRRGRLVARALYELVRYDVVHGLFKVPPVKSKASRPAAGEVVSDVNLESRVCGAVVLACCFYWKPVLCLQRSVCAMRMLRARGVQARVVIGYRPVPFFSHAWVEVDGRVVNDSPVYQQRLTVLHTI